MHFSPVSVGRFSERELRRRFGLAKYRCTFSHPCFIRLGIKNVERFGMLCCVLSNSMYRVTIWSLIGQW